MTEFERCLIDKDTIAKAVQEMGKRISEDYAGEEVLLVCILRGAYIFCADLSRAITLPTRIEFMSASSYGDGTESSGNVRIHKDLDTDITGRHVILVEDIVDSGLTLTRLRDMLKTRQPASLKICTLLSKPERRKVELEPDYCCFEIPDAYVVGYGLDYAECYRNLPDLMVLHPSVYEK